MVLFGGVVLLLNAVFNAIAWPTFLRRILRDPRARDPDGRTTAFLRVHAVLTVIATAALWAATSAPATGAVPGPRTVTTPAVTVQA